MKQGHLDFTAGGWVSIATHLCCTGERLKSAPALGHVARLHSSVMSNRAATKASPPAPPVPAPSLFAITEGDIIAWHDEIVYVKVHFIQAKCDAV